MDNNPPREEELLPRPLGTRGTRAGKSAQRKRKAYQAYIFQRDQDLGIYTNPSEVPFRRPDGSTRAVVRRPESAPFQAEEEQLGFNPAQLSFGFGELTFHKLSVLKQFMTANPQLLTKLIDR